MTAETQKKIIKWFWIIVTFPVAALLFMLLLVWMFAHIPSFKELEDPENNVATQVLADDGRMLATFHIENRAYVKYEDISPNLIQAAVATEDVRFYKHSGIDFKGLGRVLVKTLLLRHSSQGGGSTITQQLAKTLYPRNNVSNVPVLHQISMVWIKLKEWITAVKLERDYTKDEIITMYLNNIFFGSGAYGIRSASETFFGKDPSELSLEESAMLVGMVNKPTRYNPVLNYDKALQRRNFVLGQMAKADYITKEVRDSVIQLPINVDKYEVQDNNAGLAPYFRDMIKRTMTAKKPRRSDYKGDFAQYAYDSLQWCNNKFYGWIEKNKKPDGTYYNLDKDGLKIYTTINYKMQKYAEEAVADHIKGVQKSFNRELRNLQHAPFAPEVDSAARERAMYRARKDSDRYRMMKKDGESDAKIFKSFDEPVHMRVMAYNKKGFCDTTMTPNDSILYYKSMMRTALVAMEPGTGYVKAYVGGPSYRFLKWDNVMQSKRQVGSTIKPFLYTLAMQNGMTPCTEVVNTPQTIITEDGTAWSPHSTDSQEWIGRTVTLKWGLTNSSNNISAYLMKQFGPSAMVEMMHSMGIHSQVECVPSICVGSAEISLWEMVAAYNTFPSKGVYIQPIFVTKIEDKNGNVLEDDFTTKKQVAIGEETAYLMVNMMEGVVQGGTASRLRYRYHLMGEIAGKTGTTNDNADGWFIGYTPKLVAGVWTGAESRQIHFQSTAFGQGAEASLPTWGLFMQKILADGTLGLTADDKFEVPVNVPACTSGTAGSEEEQYEESYFDE